MNKWHRMAQQTVPHSFAERRGGSLVTRRSYPRGVLCEIHLDKPHVNREVGAPRFIFRKANSGLQESGDE